MKFSTSDNKADAVPSEQEALYREIGLLSRLLLQTEDALLRERAAHAVALEALAQAQHATVRYEEMLNSTSWRITAPLRGLVTRLKRQG